MRLLALAASAAIFMPGPTAAQPSCDTHEAVMALLAGKYQERRVAVGVTNAGGLVEVFATEDGATWSITVTTPGGPTCLVAAGEGWRGIEWTEGEPKA